MPHAFRLDPDASAMYLDNPLDQCQAYSRAFHFLVQLIEQPENLLMVARLDPDTVGPKSGTIAIDSNQMPDYEFDVIGEVQAPAEIRVSLDACDVADGETVPIDFGTVIQGQPGPTFTFTVYNEGAAPLECGAVQLPASGFVLTEPLAATIDPCASDTFTVQLDTSAMGTYSGSISFDNSDGGLLYGDSIDEDPYDFAIAGAVVHQNDTCETAIPAEIGVPYNGSSVGANGTDISSCGDDDPCDVWHSVTPEFDYDHVIDLFGSEFDTTLAIYDACGGNELACNDDSQVPGFKLQSRVTVFLQKGATYYIRIAGFAQETGNYTLNITGPVCAAPIVADLNDDCMVTLEDLAIFASHWLQSNIQYP